MTRKRTIRYPARRIFGRTACFVVPPTPARSQSSRTVGAVLPPPCKRESGQQSSALVRQVVAQAEALEILVLLHTAPSRPTGLSVLRRTHRGWRSSASPVSG